MFTKTIKLHPTASPIEVPDQEKIEKFNNAVKALGKVMNSLIVAVKKAIEALVKFVSFPCEIKLHPTARPVQVPFYVYLRIMAPPLIDSD